MSLLNEIVKLLSSPTWGGIGVLVSTLLAIIALVRTRTSHPDLSHQEPRVLISSPAGQRRREQQTTRWVDDDDPTGGVPDAFLPPSYWN